MQTVPLHPALVHVPLGLAFVLPVVAVGLAFALWRDLLPRRAWVVVVVLQAVLFAGAGAALRTGEGEEKRVEPIVGEAALHHHEEAAEAFLWAAGVVLAVSAGALAAPASAAAAVTWLAVAGTLVVAGLGFRTGKAGGELVYARGAAAAYTTPGAAGGGTPAVPGDRRGRRGDDD